MVLEIPNDIFPSWIDKYGSTSFIISLIVIFQGCFGGMGVAQTPVLLKNLTNNPIFRFIFICTIAYTATTDIEMALVSTSIFFIFLHMIRTDEEKKKMNFFF
jgi:hypothetical protein